MIVETYYATRSEKYTENVNVGWIIASVVYFIVTMYVAIYYPITKSVIASVLMALFLTPIFWIIKIIQLIVEKKK